MFGLFKKSKVDPVLVTVSTRTVIRILLLVLLSFLFLMALKKTSHALILIFTAFFLALALNAPVHWVSEHIPGKRKGSRSLATAVSFIVVLALIVLFALSVVPPLVHQTDNFIHAAPGIVKEVRNQNSGLGNFVRKYNLENRVNELSNQLGNRLQNLSGTAFSTITRITGSIFSLLVIFVLTFMMLIEGPRWAEVGKELLPKENQKHADKLASEMYKVIRGYVNGQVLMAAIASVVILIPLLLLHVGYPVALMVVVFICALIPMVGHTIGAVIVTTIALFHSPASALIILIYYIIYMQVEAYLLQPRIQANTTNMSPLLVFAALIIGVSFDGLLGGLVAIPVAGCIRILFLDYLNRHDLFHDPLKADTK